MGFKAVPPLGPAMPVIPRPIDAQLECLIFVAIAIAVSLETAPQNLILRGRMSKNFVFASLEYATIPQQKYLELPGILVRQCAISPPVQDSATARVSFFLKSILAIVFSIIIGIVSCRSYADRFLKVRRDTCLPAGRCGTCDDGSIIPLNNILDKY